MMERSFNHYYFASRRRVSQSLSNDRCQNILYKSVFEHFVEVKDIAALLLASKSIQNSSFGANYFVNFAVDKDSIVLLESVLSPSSCFSIQLVPSLHIKQLDGWPEKIKRGISNFVEELIKTKYFPQSLRSLTLECVTDKVLSSFFGNSSNSWPQLQDLIFEECAMKDVTLEVISEKVLQLRTVNFSGSSGVTDDGLKHLTNLSAITSLDLDGCDEITDAGLAHLQNLSGLTSLDLTYCDEITDVGLDRIFELVGITSLNLSYCDKISSASLVNLSKLPSIKFLSVSYSKIVSADLEHISKVATITSLDLSGCFNITDAGLRHLSNLSGITSLDFRGCYHITNAGVEHLSKLSAITNLSLFGCNKVTDVGLGHISRLANITSLDLSFCVQITTEAKQQFKTAKPRCNVIG